jgi:Tol biopolymer transport system component
VRNGKICFVRRSEQNAARLFTVNPDGSDVRTLGDARISLGSPAWSPDGSRVVILARDRSDDAMFLGELHLLDADGKGLTRITHERSVKLRPAWSPGGTEIVFERGLGTSGFHLFAMRPDGTGLRQITGPPMRDAPAPGPLGPVRGWVAHRVEPQEEEEMPSWSPDGSRIAFVRGVRREPQGPRDWGGAHHLFTVAADGSDERQITDGAVHDLDPAWSPDGTKLVFARYTDDEVLPLPGGGSGSAVRLWTVRPDGGGLEVLAPEPANYMDPCWSPDGTVIVCSRSDHRPTHTYAIDIEGGSGHMLTAPETDGDYEPAWQPVP